jgi:CBS domain containing-hemolysin-like protein/mannitol/fructose-specific phosphotransferase system IIA component (Ntr-type)
MILLVYLLAALLLLLLNAFFVLAEFAAVKARPTQMEALAARGSRRAKIVEHIQTRLDEYLSVCQVGITLASIGLGFVGEPTFVVLLEPMVRLLGIAGLPLKIATHTVAVAVAYLLVSFLHIVIGELIPKSVAIRRTERSALLTAYPMVVFRYIFIAPIWVLNATVNGVLRIFRLPPVAHHGVHSEDEIRIILDQSQESGVLSFRRLLHIENVLDMGTLVVRNAMRARRLVRCLSAVCPRSENDAVIAEYRYSRYPLLGEDPEKPLGYVHLKDLYLAERNGRPTDNLMPFLRPCLSFRETDPLEARLSEMQRKACHMALVFSEAGRWTGIITLEDAVEEVIGTIEEEYPTEPPVRLSDLLMPEHTLLDVAGVNILSATRNALRRLPPGDLPLPVEQLMLSVAERERLGASYIGKGLAIPHARLMSLKRPMVIVARMKEPMPSPVSGESISILFILLTPADTPRIHQILLSHIAGIFESGYLEERLEAAALPADLHAVICTAEQVVLG